MAVKTLNEGATDWSNSASWTPSGVPEDGDEIRIIDGSQIIDTGLNQAARAFLTIKIASTFRGSLGTSGAPLVFTNVTGSGAVIIIGGGANVYLAPSGTIPDLYVQKSGAGELRLNTGTWTLIRHWAGRTVLEDAATPTTVHAAGGNVDLRGRTNTLTTLNVGQRGTVTSVKNVTTANVAGQFTTSRTASGGAAVATMNVWSGSVKHRSGGALTTINGFGGSFSPAGGTDYTVTNVLRFDGFHFDRDAPGAMGTVSGSVVDVGTGSSESLIL